VFVASLLTQRDNDSNLEGCIFLNLILPLSLRRVPFPPKTLTRAQPEEMYYATCGGHIIERLIYTASMEGFYYYDQVSYIYP
jgi:hypothetical protein